MDLVSSSFSIEKFELALAKDPQFALAHVGIADAYNFLVGYGHSPPKISYPKAKEELQKEKIIKFNAKEDEKIISSPALKI